MAEAIIQLKHTILRIYSGDGTPYFVESKFLGGTLSIKTGRERPEQILHLNQGKADSLVHYVSGDDTKALEPIELGFDLKLYSSVNAAIFRKACSNPDDDSTWQPDGSDTWTGVTSLGSTINADGTSVNFPTPHDAHIAAHLVNVEVLATVASGTSFGRQFTGCFFPPGDVDFANPDSMLKMSGRCYGAVAAITSFTSGTETT